jgi:hypothetical protein
MSKHTPGPWEWWTSNSWRRLRSNPADGRDVGVVVPFVARDGHPDLEVSAADMSLIASAPDLLALAKQYASECSECGGRGMVSVPRKATEHFPEQRPCPACADIRAVIRKAEGMTTSSPQTGSNDDKA